MKKLYIIISIVICSFTNIFNIKAEPLTIFIDPEAYFNGYNDGSDWPLAFQSINQALEYTDVTGRDVIFLLKYGVHEPIKICGTGIRSVEIYGGCDEWCISPDDRLLDDPNMRTIIQGTDNLPAIWLESLAQTSRNIIDGLTLIGGGMGESLAIRMIGTCETIFSRCRIEDANHPGNLIFIEGNNFENNPDYLISFVNTIISDNNVTNIVKTFFSCRFVNSTIVNNTCSNFMSINNPHAYDIFEIKNSIVTNTSCATVGGNVMVYNSSVANFRYFVDMENNTSGLNVEFTYESDEPYRHMPNQYITARGNIDYYTPYANISLGNRDIRGNRRYERTSLNIDLGAYQCSQTYSRSYVPEFIEEEYEAYEEDMTLNEINIYPTKLNSGENLYFEHNLESSLFVKIYNLNGIEVVYQDITNNDNIFLSLPTGMYIVTMCDSETQEIVRQEKIVITN